MRSWGVAGGRHAATARRVTVGECFCTCLVQDPTLARPCEPVTLLHMTMYAHEIDQGRGARAFRWPARVVLYAEMPSSDQVRLDGCASPARRKECTESKDATVGAGTRETAGTERAGGCRRTLSTCRRALTDACAHQHAKRSDTWSTRTVTASRRERHLWDSSRPCSARRSEAS